MYNERNGNIFDDIVINKVNPNVIYMQCGSGDLALGAGIARSFNAYFNTRKSLLELRDNLIKNYPDEQLPNVGGVYYTSPVLTLITKERFYNKPTLKTLESCLILIPDIVKKLLESDEEVGSDIKEVRCPMIGCGLDKLKWTEVKPLLVKLAGELDKLGVDLNVIDYRLGDDK